MVEINFPYSHAPQPSIKSLELWNEEKKNDLSGCDVGNLRPQIINVNLICFKLSTDKMGKTIVLCTSTVDNL